MLSCVNLVLSRADEVLANYRASNMAFSDEVVLKAWKRAGGRCQCRRRSHGHSYGRCNKELVFRIVVAMVEGVGRPTI